MAITLQLAPHIKGCLASQRLHPKPFRSAISPYWVPAETSSTQQSLYLVSFCLGASDRAKSFAADRQIERSLEPTVLAKITIIEKAIQLSFEEGQT